MEQLFTLLSTIFSIVFIVFLIALFGLFFGKKQFESFLMLSNEMELLHPYFIHIKEFLDEFELFIRIRPDPEPFHDFDISAFQIYSKLKKSLLIASTTLDNLILLEDYQITPNFSTLFFKGWPVGRELYHKNKELKTCLYEGQKWDDLVDEINFLKQTFAQFQEQLSHYVQEVDPIVNALEIQLSELKKSGVSQLNSSEANIRWVKQLFNDVLVNLSNIPEIRSDATTINKYRLLIIESHASLKQIEVSSIDVRVDLHRIKRAQIWCKVNLSYLDNLLLILRARLDKDLADGLDVNGLVETWQDLQFDAEDAYSRFKEGTPESLTFLCGDLAFRGSKESFLKKLERKIFTLDANIKHFEAVFHRMKKLVFGLRKAIQHETVSLDRLERKGYELDISREEIVQSVSNLNKVESFIQTGKLEACDYIPELIESGHNYIQASHRVRLNLEEQISQLPILLQQISPSISTIATRTNTVTSGLTLYNYQFNEPAEKLVSIANNIQTDFVSISTFNINKALQSRLLIIFEKAKELERTLENFLANIVHLEKTLNTFETLFQKIKVCHERIIKQYEKLISLSKHRPLEEWKNSFEAIGYRVESWQGLWSTYQTTGNKFEEFHKLVSELETDCYILEDQFHQDRKKWNDKIVKEISQLHESLSWIDLRLKRTPRPSINFHDIRKQAVEFESESKKKLAEQYPLELMILAQQLELFVGEITSQIIIVEREEENFNKLLEKTKNAYEQAAGVQNRIRKFRPTVEDSNGNIIGHLTPITSVSNEWFEELEYQKNDFLDVLKQTEYLSVEQLVFKLEGLRNFFRDVRRVLVEELKRLHDNRDQIKSLDDVLNDRIFNLYHQLQYERLTSYQKDELNRQIDGVNRLQEKAKESLNFQSSILYFNKAIELAEIDIPDIEVTNQYLNFAERQILTGTYNEGSNYGWQSGRDINIS